MKPIKQIVHRLLTGNQLGKYIVKKSVNYFFPGSAKYWENRYLKNGNSGKGSYGANAQYKALVLNQFVAENNISKVIELGCGDGNQLKQFMFPFYIGLDVSPTAIQKCGDIFKEDVSKSFFLYNEKAFADNGCAFIAELALSLDVIYHLVEDEVFENYMHSLFSASTQFVIIYAWDVEEEKKYHVRHRNFTQWIESNIRDFQLIETIKGKPGEHFCDFFIYKK
ncbi:MAG: class I SAM-dependent methyltransferase [Bacteroidota bacterium]|nr:class I SAM-dependent methyltransferase [Bacteroidota bacterium]